jgi:hypothetical protein
VSTLFDPEAWPDPEPEPMPPLIPAYGTSKRGKLRLAAYKKKDQEPYSFTVGEHHVAVLRFVAEHGRMTDQQVAMSLGIAQAGARRCELRDAGCLEKIGTHVSPQGHRFMVWALTEKGRTVLHDLTATMGA